MDRDKLFQIGAIALGCFTAWAAFHIIDSPPMTRGELADWAQGLGSVAAVGIAAWVGTLPIRHEATIRRQQRLDFLDSVFTAAMWAHQRQTVFRDAVKAGDQRAIVQAIEVLAVLEPELVLRKVLEVPFDRWPDTNLLVRVQDALAGLQNLQTKTAALTEYEGVWTERQWERIRRRANGLLADHERLLAAISESRAKA